MAEPRAVSAPVEARAVATAPVPRSSSNGATMLRTVPDTAPQPIDIGRVEDRAIASPAARPEPKVPVNSISDIADLCAKNRDIKLKTLVRGFLRLVHIEPGRLDVNLPDDAPKTLLGELAVKLKEWTGIHWVVSYSREPGEPTLVEAEQRAQEQRVNDARQDGRRRDPRAVPRCQRSPTCASARRKERSRPARRQPNPRTATSFRVMTSSKGANAEAALSVQADLPKDRRRRCATSWA